MITQFQNRPRGRWQAITARGFASILAFVCVPMLGAQNLISVPFTRGFIGTRGSSAGSANNVLTFQTLEISRMFFIQNSSTSTFELQGNDIPGTLRIVRTSGVTLDVPASANWRNSGGTTYLLGVLPRPAAPIAYTYAGGSISITDGSVNGGSSIGGYFAGYTGATVSDGQSTSGNAAQSQLLSALNAYLQTVVSSRPAGPVTVAALNTTSTTPTISGTATIGTGENLTVVVNGVQYSTTTPTAVNIVGSAWSLTLTTPLATGTYDIAATITNSDGFTLSDATQNELVISTASTTLTIGGSFSASDKVYDGTTSVSTNAGGLTLIGVNSPDQVTIASATFAFQSASAGSGRTVTLTGVTLGGADAGSYTVGFTGAPTTTAAITARVASIGGISAQGRMYDGSVVATLTGTPTYGNLAPAESFSVTGTPTATFATSSVGTAKAVMVSGYSAPSANYSVTQPSGLAATISPRSLSVGGSFSVANRPYDGTTSATISGNALTLASLVTGDTVALTAVSATFADAAVGTAKTVSITSATIGGVSAGNYTLSLTGAPTATADITSVSSAVTIGGAFSANGKVYDGSLSANGVVSGLTIVGANPSHQVTIASATFVFQAPTAGTGRTVTLTSVTLGGADAGSYTVNLAGSPTTTATISPAPLTLTGTFTAADKVVDGSASATIASQAITLQGVLSPDVVTLGVLSAQFNDATLGTGKPVSLTSFTIAGADAANYVTSVAGAPTTTASILSADPPSVPRTVTATPAAESVSITWSTPAIAGCSVARSYAVDVSRDGGATWTRSVIPAPSTGATIASLVNNVAYMVRVAAVNDCGTGPWSTPVAFVPVAVTRDNSGTPRTSSAGAASVTVGGTTTPLLAEVVQDTVLMLGRGSSVTLSLRTVDSANAAIRVDSTRTVSMEQGGRVLTGGSGFRPGTIVTVYLYSNAAPTQVALIAQVVVAADGSFDATAALALSTQPGPYTLQVNGIDQGNVPRSVAIGVEVTEPPAELTLSSTADNSAPVTGDTVVITLRVVNHGRGPAIDVAIPRAFSEPGFRIVATQPVHGTYDDATHTWRIPRIEAGATALMRITAIVIAPTSTPVPTP